MTRDYLTQLRDFLGNKFKEFSVVTMPDFFLDRLVSLGCNADSFCRNLRRVTKKKGGSADNIAQIDLRGGNAVNTASALAALDVSVTPIVCTSKLGEQLIKYYLTQRSIDFSHLKICGNASTTTAIEFETEEGKINFMLRDVGGLADFGSRQLSQKDFASIEDADYVCVFNWAGTRRFGTELAKSVFHLVKTKGRGRTYYDTADPAPNEKKIPKLIQNVLQSNDIDILSLNENEAVTYAKHFSGRMKQQKNVPLDELAKQSARVLAAHLSARIDLHTTKYSATFDKKKETVVPSFSVPVLRATGAGDAWNAGNILGDAHGLSDSRRLALANTVAAYYISSPNAGHPSQKQLIRFCAKLKTKHSDGTI